MTTPVCLGHPWVHLDGILCHLQKRELDGQKYYLLPSKEVQNMNRGAFTALDKVGPLNRGSISFFEPDELYSTTIYKRFHTSLASQMPWKKQIIERGSGKLRDWMIRLPYIPAKKVIFYGHGDIHEVLRLLSYLPGIGKKTVAGFGAYKSVEVNETPEDRSIVYNGRAMRPIPLWMLDEAEETFRSTYYAPYWDKSTVTECAFPGAKIKLKSKWEEQIRTS